MASAVPSPILPHDLRDLRPYVYLRRLEEPRAAAEAAPRLSLGASGSDRDIRPKVEEASGDRRVERTYPTPRHYPRADSNYLQALRALQPRDHLPVVRLAPEHPPRLLQARAILDEADNRPQSALPGYREVLRVEENGGEERLRDSPLHGNPEACVDCIDYLRRRSRFNVHDHPIVEGCPLNRVVVHEDLERSAPFHLPETGPEELRVPHVYSDEELVSPASPALIDDSVGEGSSEPPSGESHLPRRDDIDLGSRGDLCHQRSESIGRQVGVDIRVSVADDGYATEALCLDEGEPLPRAGQLDPR